jgi:cyanate permease
MPYRKHVLEERQISTVVASLTDGPHQQQASVWRSRFKYATIVLLGCILMCFALNNNHMISFFLTSFALDIGMKKQDAGLLTGFYELCYTTARLIAAFAAIKLGVRMMLFICLLLIAAGNLILLLNQHNTVNDGTIWIAVALMGTGASTLVGAVYVLVEQMIDVTDVISGLLTFSGSIASIIMAIVLGNFMKQHPYLFIQLMLLNVTVCLIVLFLFYLIDR